MEQNSHALSENQLISAPFLPGRARVKKFANRGRYSVLEVVLEENGEFRSLRLTDDQVAEIETGRDRPEALRGDPEDFFLRIEAQRIRLAHEFDPMLAVSVSQVDPLPHQIEAVYRHALEQPRLRFLIADDPGAGKTIMAGLILKEMQARRLVRRVLIVAPGHLKYQWQREMKEKFGLAFRLVDRNVMRAAWAENVWQEHPHLITSIDFIKQDDIKATLSGGHWDLVIVDEAHKMSAYAYETRERVKIDKTKRYQAGEVLSRRTDHLLFLTATPHRGDDENFRLFLDLLRPQFFAKTEQLQESVSRGENPLFIRRLKEDMRTFDGRPIFPPRHVHTVPFRMTDPEVRLYNAVTGYVKNYYDQAKENRHVSFALMILQRRLTSSVHAILSSLERRKEKLEDLLHRSERLREEGELAELRKVTEAELEDYEDYEEAERWAIEEKLEQITVAENIDELRPEIRKLDELITQADEVRAQEVESKLTRLRDEVLSNLEGRKVLIFTEHKDTLWYLTEKLNAWGYSVCTIHGGMDLDSRIAAEHTFRHDAQILVATEAAGEGINLQFCSWMVNYDIPWNPTRLEQRMGRIHRYGQDREVYIYNLISQDTLEGRVLDRLFEKLDRMRKAMGTDRVFDVIGDVIRGRSLGDLLREAVLGQRRMEEIEGTIEEIDEGETRDLLDRIFLTSLATRHIDYTGMERLSLEAEENRLVPEYVEDFFLRGFRRLGGRVVPVGKGYRVETVPHELRRLNDDYTFKTTHGRVRREYRRISFDKSTARNDPSYEFVAPGHPLLEALNEIVLEKFGADSERYVVFEDPEGVRLGALWFVEGVVIDGSGRSAGRRVFALLQEPGGEIRKVNPAVLWDLEPARERDVPREILELVTDRNMIEEYVVGEVLLPYREEIHEDRSRDAEVKRRYGLRSLDYLITESNGKLLEYESRSSEGEDMAAAIRQERRRLEELGRRRAELEREIRLESNLTVEDPRILGIAAIVPPVTYSPEPEEGESPKVREGTEPEPDLPESTPGGAGMRSDEEIELVGMEVARKYEKEEGWRVEDVSKEEHGGFDLRSLKLEDDGRIGAVRYIEVKARATSGAIRLTANEWKKARHFGSDYWLYVVTDAGTDSPSLTRIRDPASLFREEEDIFATGFIIPEGKWQGQVKGT